MTKHDLVIIASWFHHHDIDNPAKLEIYQKTDHLHLLDPAPSFTEETEKEVQRVKKIIEAKKIKNATNLKRLKKRKK